MMKSRTNVRFYNLWKASVLSLNLYCVKMTTLRLNSIHDKDRSWEQSILILVYEYPVSIVTIINYLGVHVCTSRDE